MRKKAINQVYDVVKTVNDLEYELKKTPVFADIERKDCSEHLEYARQQLHDVLDQVHASDFRNGEAA